MRVLSTLLALIALAACGGPSAHFKGIAPVRIAVSDSVFDVRVRGNLAESIRVNPQYAPRLGPIADRAAIAMAQASGCKVTSVLGDQALQIGQLDCGSGSPSGIRTIPQYECLEIPSGVTREDGAEYLDYDCSPY